MKRLIIMTSMAAAIGCSADITPEDVRIADYKDGKEPNIVGNERYIHFR